MKKPPRPASTPPLRVSAETRLRQHSNANNGAGGARSPADTQRLLHEFQVHQIALEMQNEELRRARDEMEAALEKYAEFYNFAPVGYLTVNAQGAILEANLTATSLLGIPRAPLVKQGLRALVSLADRPIFDLFLPRIFKSTERQECDLQLQVKDKPPVDVRLRTNHFQTGAACRIAITDITEHKQVENKVHLSEIRFRRLFETAHDGVLLLDPVTCKITDANPFMTKLLGYARDQLVGKELFEIGLLKDETASQEMFQKLTKDHEVRYEDLPLESNEGRHQEVEVVANLYEENGQAVIQCNIRDITARKQAETALRESEERYRGLFNSIDEGFCVIEMLFDKQGHPADYRFLEMNPSFEKQCGIHNGHGKRIKEIVSHIEPCWLDAYGKVARTGRPIRFSDEMKALHRWFDVYAFRLGGDESRKVAVIFSDITVQKKVEMALHDAQVELTRYAGQLELKVVKRTTELTKSNRQLKGAVVSVGKGKEQVLKLFLESQLMHKKLRLLTQQLISAQEEERKRISRELHDQVVQTLVGINVELSAVKLAASTESPELIAKIAHTQKLVEDSVVSVHRFSRALRPALLDDLGLIPALHAYNKNMAARNNLKINMTAFAGVEALTEDKRTVLFRVAQEALTNVVRHARATRVKISIVKIPDAVRMEISDNGKSFPVRKTLLTKTNKRLGLVGMRERIEMVGGSLVIESTPGHGTTVRAEISFKSEKNKK